MINYTVSRKTYMDSEWQDITSNVIQPLSDEQQLDVELDSGQLTYYKKGNKAKLYSPLAMYKIEFSDESGREVMYLIGTESLATLRLGLYKCVVQLTEPTKLLEGVLTDGYSNTQPEDLTTAKTLQEVLQRMFDTSPLHSDTKVGNQFTLTADNNVLDILKTVSPEFKFTDQSTLWECLVDVGSVVCALPRLKLGSDGKYSVVDFDFISEAIAEIDNVERGSIVEMGLSIDEEHYNDKLQMVVENLIEEI